MPTKRTIVWVPALLLAAAGGFLVAGPLNPPGGPVASTYKTLSEVEPRTAINATNAPGDVNTLYKISQPGSYYLTGNLAGVANKHGIQVVADNVTIDLCGFTLTGVPTGRDAIHGDGGPGLTGLVIRNGTISGWGAGSGIYAGSVSKCRADGLTISSVTYEGMWFGAQAQMSSCAVTSARNGLRAGPASVFTNCTVDTTTERGIDAGLNCVIQQCITRAGTIAGINTSDACTLQGCTATTSAIGIQTGQGCTLSACCASANSGQGIHAGTGSSVLNCSVLGNGAEGVFGVGGVTIESCTASTNLGTGLNGNSGSLISRCVSQNNAAGISVGAWSSVCGCAVYGNTDIGIFASQESLVSGNQSAHNGQASDAGIVVFSKCRIEGNLCTSNVQGIKCNSSNNILVGNSCSGNTINWNIASNNVFGPVILRTSPGSASWSGDQNASSLNTTDPAANYTF